MDEFKVPIYLMTGFLESGKTSFLNFTLAQEYFQIDEPTLLILCEEGEEEYDKKVLKKSRTSVEVIDSIEELTTERLVAYDAFYNPGRVIIEYNVAGKQIRRTDISVWMGNRTAYCDSRCKYLSGIP